MNPVEISHLTKHYPDFSLNDVTFSVPAGYVTGFVGANGSGKTTTIKAALGMIHPDSGSATTVGHERIGVVFDAPPYNPEWRLKDLGRGIGRFFPTWSQERYDAELQAAGLNPAKKVKELSRGMGMRLQMAVALAHEPELLILDEPTNGLDPAGIEEVRRLLVELAGEGVTVMVSSHLLDEIDRMASTLGILSAGRLVFQGTRAELMERSVPDILIVTPTPQAVLNPQILAGLVPAQALAVSMAADFPNPAAVPVADTVASPTLTSQGVRIPGMSKEAVAELISRLAAAGVELHEVRREAQSLEDVFMDLTGRGGVL